MSSELGYLDIMGVAFGITTISILQAEIHEAALKMRYVNFTDLGYLW